MQQTISVLGGTGALGRGLAARLARAGHPVVLGSRDATRAEAAAEELRTLVGPDTRVSGVVNHDAAAAADVILLATPWEADGATVAELASQLAGRVVVSCINPLGFDAQGPYGLDVAEGSAAEQVAALLPGSTVTAAFHHLSAPSLVDLDRDLSHEDVLVCGDDAIARATVAELARAVTGRRGVEVGTLRQARQLEPFTAVLIAVNKRYRTRAGVFMANVDVERVAGR